MLQCIFFEEIPTRPDNPVKSVMLKGPPLESTGDTVSMVVRVCRLIPHRAIFPSCYLTVWRSF